MGFIQSLFERVKRYKRFYKVPTRVQDIIHIDSIDLDTGIFYHGKNTFTKQYLFSDVNFETLSEANKEEIREKYSQIINTFSSGGRFKITLDNRVVDLETYATNSILRERGDELDYLRREHNKDIETKMINSNSIDTRLILTLVEEAETWQDAINGFNQIERSVRAKLHDIGSNLVSLNCDVRLKYLMEVYRPHINAYEYDLKSGLCLGRDYKDYICPDSCEIKDDKIILENQGEYSYLRVFFVKEYGAYINDDVLYVTLSMPKNVCLSIDCRVVPLSEAKKIIEKKLFMVEDNITKWQAQQNKADNFSAEIPYAYRIEKNELEQMLSDLNERDQNLCETVVTVLLMGKTEEELEQVTKSLYSNCKDSGLEIAVARTMQVEGLNTALPVGCNEMLVNRTLITECLATLMPFRSTEMQHENGVYYGINPLSKKPITINKDYFKNQNAFILGTSGSGKSMTAKNEILSTILKDDDTDVIIIDPEAEYGKLVSKIGGEIIKLDASTSTRINALDLSKEYSKESTNPIAVKSDFIISLIGRMNEEPLTAVEKSIIDRCLSKVYKDYIKSNCTGKCPTLVDLMEEFNNQKEDEAHKMAKTIELFASGSLDMFGKDSNVDINNRLVCYDIRDLGENLKPIAMLVVLDSIFNRMAANKEKKRKTAVFIDEIYLMFQQESTENYLMILWKRCRKYGCSMTGITQNISDLLRSEKARNMLNNSDFLVLLAQNDSDKDELAELLNISNTQLPYLSMGVGEGLLRVEQSVILPFENKIPVDTATYKLLTSKMTDED